MFARDPADHIIAIGCLVLLAMNGALMVLRWLNR